MTTTRTTHSRNRKSKSPAKSNSRPLRAEIAAQFKSHDPAAIADQVRNALGWPGKLADALHGLPTLVLAAVADVARFRGDDAHKVEPHGQEEAEWRCVYYAALWQIRQPNRFASIGRALKINAS